MVFGAACAMLVGANAHAQAGAACNPGGTVEETTPAPCKPFRRPIPRSPSFTVT